MRCSDLKRKSDGVFAVGLAIATVLAFDASAADQGKHTLSDMNATVSWTGEFQNAALPLPEACVTNNLLCDTLEVNLNLPSGTWDTPGGMLVLIDWGDIDGGYDLDVFVYDEEGNLVAKSDSTIYSSAEGAWFANPANGKYRVIVVPKTVIGELPYKGIVQLDEGITVSRAENFAGLPDEQTFVAPGTTSASPVVELIPDIVPTKPKNFHIESTAAASFYVAFDRDLGHQPSCLPQEMLGLTSDSGDLTPGSGPVRCLRWDQGEHNFGKGPFQLRNYPDEDDGNKMYQAVFSTDGSYRLAEVGTAFFNPDHGHFHYDGFQTVTLHALDADGNWDPDQYVRRAPNKGICMVDIRTEKFGEKGVTPSQFRVPGTCDAQLRSDPNDPTFDSDYFRMGISVGWSDLYPWFIPDQYVDITDLPDGKYVMRVVMDKSGRLVESDASNNEITSCIDIQGTTATPCD